MISTSQKLSSRIDLTIPMERLMELIVTNVSESIMSQMGFDEKASLEVSAAIIEACNNAFQHSDSPDRKVYVSFFPEDNEYKIILRDHGNGFAVKEPAEIEIKPVLKKRGWGLIVMHEMVDKFSIISNHDGTEVTLIKYLIN